MAVSSNEMIKVRNKGLDIHKEIIYQYTVLGYTQEVISNDLGFKSGWDVSSVVRAYNFNKKRGESLGVYKNVSRELIDEFVELHYPGFIDDDSITFSKFLKYQGRSTNISASSQSSVKGAEKIHQTGRQAPFYTIKDFEIDNQPTIDRGSGTYTKSTTSKYYETYPDSTFLRKIGIIGIVALIVYYLFTKMVLPLVDLGVFNVMTMFQKDVSIQQTQPKDSRYIGEIGWLKKSRGYGLLYFEPSKIHIGKFKNGKRQGEGIEILNDGTIEYIGNFRNNNYDDFGMIVNDEMMYVGEIQKGKKHGMGAIIDNINEVITIREYEQDKLTREHAIINYVTREAQVIKDSTYKVFQTSGQGILVGTHKESGFTVDISNGYAYFGMYEKGKAKGYGIRINGNGNIEYGDKRGKQTKNAILYLEGEGITLGNFKKQTKEGYGMEYILSGEIYIGNYQKSKRHGKGTYMFLDGTTKKVKYKNGVLLGES